MSGDKKRTGEVVNDDMGVTIRWEASDTWMDFMAKCHTRQDDGSVIYYADEEVLCNMPTEDFDKANRLVGGFIKWDGCGEWDFGTEEGEGRIHFCGASHIRQLTWSIEQVFALAKQHMPSFDEELAK